jgi:ADP-heptose:LPS heptosyltransferase
LVKDTSRFLVCRPDRIGDVVLSTPIPRELKRKYPHSFVAVLVREYTRDIYLNNPYVDEIILYENSDDKFWEYVMQLRKFNFDYAFMLLPKEKLNWILFFSRIKHRIGVGHKFYQFITNTKSVYRYKYNPLRHEADYCLDMVRKVGINPESVNPEIHLTLTERITADEIKMNLCPAGEFLVGINATSGQSAPNWYPNDYRILIDKLLKVPGIKIAITDLRIPEELENINSVIYINENNSLRDSIVNLSAFDLLISASTGPMHIAAALKVKTISLFSRETACSPQLWGPLGNQAEILLPSEEDDRKYCFPNSKNYHFEGEGGISAEKVLQETLKILNITL